MVQQFRTFGWWFRKRTVWNQQSYFHHNFDGMQPILISVTSNHSGSTISKSIIAKHSLSLHLQTRGTILHNKNHIITTSRHKIEFCCPKLIWDILIQSGKVCCGLSAHLKLVSEIMEVRCSRLKRKKSIQINTIAKFKIQDSWWYGALLVRIL